MIWLSVLITVFGFSKSENLYSLSAEEFFALPQVNQPINRDQPDYQLLEAAVFHASNQARKSENLEALSCSGILLESARFHSESMRKHGYFSHLNPRERKYQKPFQRIEVFGGGFKATGENLAQVNVLQLGPNNNFYIDGNGNLVDADRKPLKPKTYAQLAQNVVQGWMNSPGHRANLLGEYSHIGCGVSRIFTGKGKMVPEILITQNFGLQ